MQVSQSELPSFGDILQLESSCSTLGSGSGPKGETVCKSEDASTVVCFKHGLTGNTVSFERELRPLDSKSGKTDLV